MCVYVCVCARVCAHVCLQPPWAVEQSRTSSKNCVTCLKLPKCSKQIPSPPPVPCNPPPEFVNGSEDGDVTAKPAFLAFRGEWSPGRELTSWAGMLKGFEGSLALPESPCPTGIPHEAFPILASLPTESDAAAGHSDFKRLQLEKICLIETSTIDSRLAFYNRSGASTLHSSSIPHPP